MDAAEPAATATAQTTTHTQIRITLVKFLFHIFTKQIVWCCCIIAQNTELLNHRYDKCATGSIY